MGDGRFAGSSEPVEPKNTGVLILDIKSEDSIHNSIHNGGSGVRMELRGVECVSSVVKCSGCYGLLETLKPA